MRIVTSLFKFVSSDSE